MPMLQEQHAAPVPRLSSSVDLVCFSHLRWDWVFQRPQHLLSRFARDRRVLYVEEPLVEAVEAPTCRREHHGGVTRVIPVLPGALPERDRESSLRSLVDECLQHERVDEFIAWYYTPMALPFTDHLEPAITVYDCMDELTGFAGAPERLRLLERYLFKRADVVFTGGRSLYEAKRDKHHNIHAFPSSIDREHFYSARKVEADPPDQSDIPHPRIGYYGVIDERIDYALLAEVARRRKDWQFVMVGPVTKVDPAMLPAAPNLHYLGPKQYAELPGYLGGWDGAMMPFARNESTRFISPTKTPEYLAGGVPVVSTSIRDVVDPYWTQGLVEIADEPEKFVRAIERAMLRRADHAWLSAVDKHLAGISWDSTWRAMTELLARAYPSTAEAGALSFSGAAT